MYTNNIKESLSTIQGIKLTDVAHAARGFCLDIQVPVQSLLQAAETIDRAGYFIEAITGVDWLGEKAALQKDADDRAKAAAAAAAAEGEQPPSLPAREPREPEADEMEIVYDFNHYDSFCRITMRVRVLRHKAELPTISAIYPGADWHERETHDFFGIKFIGHPNLIPLLLPEDSDFHPLLKDFKV